MTIIPTKPIPEGNVTAKATDHAEHPNSSTSDPVKATDTTPPTKPSVVGSLDGKAGTTDPVEVTTDPNTKVELLDKDGNVIGSGITDGTGHAFITPTKPIPEGNVYVKQLTMQHDQIVRFLNLLKQLIQHHHLNQ